jgi:hypothetical protein
MGHAGKIRVPSVSHAVSHKSMGHPIGHVWDACFSSHVPRQAIDKIRNNALWDTWDTDFAVPYVWLRVNPPRSISFASALAIEISTDLKRSLADGV